jgi:hypothetical protein
MSLGSEADRYLSPTWGTVSHLRLPSPFPQPHAPSFWKELFAGKYEKEAIEKGKSMKEKKKMRYAADLTRRTCFLLTGEIFANGEKN